MKLISKKSKRSKNRVQENGYFQMKEEQKNLLTPNSGFFVREAYKTLRTNVMFSLAGESDCKVVVVTSSLQSEGKSITAVNLAVSYVQSDKKVLMIDCDLRRPKLARLLSLNAPVGLSNLILHPESAQQAIVHSDALGLDVILSGDIPPNPSELLGSARMQKLLEVLKRQYDYIILDTPPVNMVTDAVVLAPSSDGVLFVVRANQSERGAVLHAVEQLEYAKAKILGFVLNGVDLEKNGYGYGKYRYKKYGYGYGYGYAQAPEADGQKENDYD